MENEQFRFACGVFAKFAMRRNRLLSVLCSGDRRFEPDPSASDELHLCVRLAVPVRVRRQHPRLSEAGAAVARRRPLRTLLQATALRRRRRRRRRRSRSLGIGQTAAQPFQRHIRIEQQNRRY